MAEYSPDCLNCGTPQKIFSPNTARYLVNRTWGMAKKAGELSIHLALAVGGLYLCYKISLFLVLIPILFAGSTVASDH